MTSGNEILGMGHAGNIFGAGNSHHSLSMFDSETSGNNNANQFATGPLQHQLSQNAILAPQHHHASQNYVLSRVNDEQYKQLKN